MTMVYVLFLYLLTDVIVFAAARRSRQNTYAVCIAAITLLIIVLFVSVLFFVHSLTDDAICHICHKEYYITDQSDTSPCAEQA